MADDQTVTLVAVEVSAEFQKILADYPLPATVQDADMNQEELASALNQSVNTIAKWIRQEGMPVAQAGGNGKSYVLRLGHVLRLSHCWAWLKARDADRDLRSQHNKQQAAALQAEMLGLDVSDPNAHMTPKARREMAEADLVWNKAQRERRTLVQLDEVHDLLESVLTMVRDGIEAMPDLLERELNLKPDQVAAAVAVGHDILTSLTEKIEAAELQERTVADLPDRQLWMN
ncbi:DUF1441 family protein [Ketogulonicigenium vulgare]|uniref:DUF1441 family protein n=1 Tax=Ketogulonicigenium vulgare TaxID=92945 RepID=UPI0005C6CBF0|nr:DUF1441 family protein [Ketogulonicigenium vulgare]